MPDREREELLLGEAVVETDSLGLAVAVRLPLVEGEADGVAVTCLHARRASDFFFFSN